MTSNQEYTGKEQKQTLRDMTSKNEWQARTELWVEHVHGKLQACGGAQWQNGFYAHARGNLFVSTDKAKQLLWISDPRKKKDFDV